MRLAHRELLDRKEILERLVLLARKAIRAL